MISIPRLAAVTAMTAALVSAPAMASAAPAAPPAPNPVTQGEIQFVHDHPCHTRGCGGEWDRRHNRYGRHHRHNDRYCWDRWDQRCDRNWDRNWDRRNGPGWNQPGIPNPGPRPFGSS